MPVGRRRNRPGRPDPVPALLSAFVDHQCQLRLALAAIRTHRYAYAERVLTDELDHQTHRPG